MEKLFELTPRAAYDLLVLDTPPSRNALDFLDAPRRLTSSSRVVAALLHPPDRTRRPRSRGGAPGSRPRSSSGSSAST